VTADARSSSPSRARGALAVAGLLACLGGYLITQFGDALRVPFINDDYIFIDLTRSASFLSLFHPHDWWVGGWYRPWSRELHYWALQRMFGTAVAPWHVVSFGLWVAAMGLYYTLARRLAGARTAGVAVAGVAALSAWSVPLVWVAGVQELWMLVWALLTLQLWVRGKVKWATVTFALALLSKETAALVPVIALAEAVVVERERVTVALRRLAPLLGVLAVWALLHPLLGGRVWWSHPAAPAAISADSSAMAEPNAGDLGAAAPVVGPATTSKAMVLVKTPLSLVDLEAVPRPEFGWRSLLPRAVPGMLLLGGLVGAIVFTRRRKGSAAAIAVDPARLRRIMAFGAVWAVLGWLPLLLPSLGWHTYYGLLGALGAWLALSAWLESRPVLAVVTIVAMAFLRVAQAATPSMDWGSEWYQRRASEFLTSMRADLMRQHPTVPAGSRLYFTRVPSLVGFITGDAPALRVWYHDPTVSGGFFRDYRVRAPGTRGDDLFFRYDSTAGWIELTPGRADSSPGRPEWQLDHERLALALSRGGDWPGAAQEFERLARAFPDSANYAYYAGLAHVALGDRAAAAPWLARAARLPGADEAMRRAAQAVGAPPDSPAR
jgi:hypothetical protein